MIIYNPNGLKNYACDPSDGYSSMCFYTCCSRSGSISNCTQEEETSLGEDLVRSTISDVDGGDYKINGDADDAEIDQDSTDTATVNPNQEDQTVDRDNFNEFGDNTADLDTDQPSVNVGVPIATPTPTPPPPDDGLPPEGDVVFCFEPDLPREFFCFDTPEECDIAEELVGSAEEVLGSITSGCEGFETSPPGALACSVPEGGQIIRCEQRAL